MFGTSYQSFKLPPWMCIALWIMLGIMMIMFNKVLLTTWGFHYPFFLTTWHCVLATILTQTLSRTTHMLTGVEKGTVTRNDIIFRILPMSIFFASGLVLGNMAYRYISLAYIQMIKAFTPVPMLLLSFAVGKEKPSVVQLGIVLVVSLGVTLSSIGELNFSLVGFIIQITAVLGDCCRVTIMDLMLKDLNLDTLSLLYYTAPTSALLIFTGFMLFEASTFDVAVFTPDLCFMLLLNGLLAFSLNLAVIYVVSVTSGMIMSICGPIKDIAIVFVSVLIFGTPVTSTQVFGFSVSLFGLYLYQQYKRDPAQMVVYCTSAALYSDACALLCPAAGASVHNLRHAGAHTMHTSSSGAGSSIDSVDSGSGKEQELTGLLDEELAL